MEPKLSQLVFKHQTTSIIYNSKLYIKILESIVGICRSSNKSIYANVYLHLDGGLGPDPSLDYI